MTSRVFEGSGELMADGVVIAGIDYQKIEVISTKGKIVDYEITITSGRFPDHRSALSIADRSGSVIPIVSKKIDYLRGKISASSSGG